MLDVTTHVRCASVSLGTEHRHFYDTIAEVCCGCGSMCGLRVVWDDVWCEYPEAEVLYALDVFDVSDT